MILALVFVLSLQDSGRPYDGQLFDAHVHAGMPWDPKLLDRLKAAGISRAMLIIADRNGREPALDAEFVARFLPPRFDPETKELLLDDDTVSWLKEKLPSDAVRGIGEIPLRHKRAAAGFPADHPAMLQILDLAAEHRIPVNVHVEGSYAEELDRALAHNPKANIVWAHAGDASAAAVRALMKKHDNLYADLSCRNPLFRRGKPVSEQALTNGRERLKDEWKSLFEDYPDRFLFGSDVGGRNADRLPLLPDVVKYYRAVLGQLQPETARKIGCENAERLLDRK